MLSFSPRAREMARQRQAGLSMTFGHTVPLRMFGSHLETKVFPV